MFPASNYAFAIYGEIAYAMRGVAIYPFSTSEGVTASDSSSVVVQAFPRTSDGITGSDSPVPLLQANSQTNDQVIASDANSYMAVDPANILPVSSEARQQPVLQENRQYGTAENRQGSIIEKRNFTL